ncbi:DUF4186 domain-containing protein [Komagataeibacter melaceti]|uniref:DUF4186 domain-containing protein n=1 Tax=Komagataeibacter melaceti TaxID=2766577 RepID=A0A371YWJ1_9PROT|nr:DUF4186 domain-containing protein [Komagataeibacter melaceti]RFD18601.1 DUF4186 domain-containing protein [Komagataeibacter melaceti]
MAGRRAGRLPPRQGDLFAPPPEPPAPAIQIPRLPPVEPGLWARLARSQFRARFHLGTAERAYLADRGLPEVMTHAASFIATRLAPAHPARDGRQTPWRGHPVFIAQHATGTCCRGCVAKWHAIPAGQPLDAGQQAYILSVIREWLRRDQASTAPAPSTPAHR